MDENLREAVRAVEVGARLIREQKEKGIRELGLTPAETEREVRRLRTGVAPPTIAPPDVRKAQIERETRSLRGDKLQNLKKTISDTISNLRNQFQEKIRTFKTRNERIQAQNDLNRTISNVRLTSTNISGEISRGNLDELKRLDIPQKVTIGAELTPGAVPRMVDLRFTPSEIARGIAKLPLEIIRDVSFATGKAAGKIAGVAGVPTITKIIPPRRIPQKVTIGGEFVVPELEIELLSPKLIGSSVNIGTQLALLAATPGLVIAPGFVVEGTEIALDEKFTKAQRLLGVIEAEAGLLIGGLSFLSLLNDIGLASRKIKIREFEVIKGKRARVGKVAKQKQIQVQKTKKAKAKANVKDLKDAIKRANSQELKVWRDRQRELILKNIKTTQAEKDQLLVLLDSTILEAKTGKAIILEGGVIDLRLLKDALESARSRVIDLAPRGRFEALGVPGGRFEGFGVLGGKLVGIGAPKGRFKPLGVLEGRIPIFKSELEKKYGSAKNVQRVLEARTKNRLRIKDAQKTFADRIKDATKTPSALRTLERNLSANLSRQKNLSRNLSLLRSRLESAVTTLQKESLKSQQKNLLKLSSLLKTQQRQLQRQRSGIKQRLRRPRRLRKPKPKLKIPPFFPKLKREVKKKVIKKKVVKKPVGLGWHTFGLSKGKRLRLNKVPLKKSKAKDLGAWLIDTSTSRTFHIKKAKKSFQKPKTKIPSAYFSKTRAKYRPFKIRKGKKIPTPLKWIEKTGHAIDTIQEKRQLSLARRLKQIRRKK